MSLATTGNQAVERWCLRFYHHRVSKGIGVLPTAAPLQPRTKVLAIANCASADVRGLSDYNLSAIERKVQIQ